MRSISAEEVISVRLSPCETVHVRPISQVKCSSIELLGKRPPLASATKPFVIEGIQDGSDSYALAETLTDRDGGAYGR